MRSALTMVAALALAGPVFVEAQVNTADVLGHVADSSSGAIAGATLTVTNDDTGLVRTATTNAAGDYVINLLPVGRYTIQIQSEGFATFVAHVTLAAGDRQRLNAALAIAELRVAVELPEFVSLADSPSARTVVVHRGIRSTLNTPRLDPLLMSDGRHPDLTAQALAAIADHAQPARLPDAAELEALVEFERSSKFFSSSRLRRFARTGQIELPRGRRDSERRGRTFFEDTPFAGGNSKRGLCAFCHSGPLLNETNEFIPAPPFRRGARFQSVLVSEFNVAGNPVYDFVFRNEDGTTTTISSPDPGRALITGIANDPDISGDPTGEESINAFKIPSLWGVSTTEPYFHDNSAKTLEDVVRHYASFFAVVTDPAIDGDPPIVLTGRDQRDIVAFLKLLR